MIAHKYRRVTAAVSACLLAGGLAACADDGASSESTEGGIKLVQILPIDSPSLSIPGLRDGAEVAVAAINDAGGIDGRDLELTFCDDKNDPATAASCAQDAVSDGAVARVSSSGTQGAQVLPILEAAGMADFGTSPVVPIDSTSEVAFPLNVGPYVWKSQGPIVKEQWPDAKTAAVVASDLPGGEARIEMVKASAEAAGIDVVSEISIPANAADVSPVLAKVRKAKPDVVMGIISAPDMVKYWNASEATGVAQIPVLTTATGITPDLLASGGDAIAQSYFIDSYPSPTGDAEGAEQFRSDLAEFGDGAEISSDAWKAYVGVIALAEVMRSIDGDITRESLLKTLNETSDLDALYLKGIDFTQPGPFADSPRLTVTDAFLFGVEDGEMVDTGLSIQVS